MDLNWCTTFILTQFIPACVLVVCWKTVRLFLYHTQLCRGCLYHLKWLNGSWLPIHFLYQAIQDFVAFWSRYVAEPQRQIMQSQRWKLITKHSMSHLPQEVTTSICYCRCPDGSTRTWKGICIKLIWVFFLEITSLNQRKHSDRARENWLNLIWEGKAARDEQVDSDKKI